MLRMMIVPLGLLALAAPAQAQPRGGASGGALPGFRPPAIVAGPAVRHVPGAPPRQAVVRGGRPGLHGVRAHGSGRYPKGAYGWPGALAGYGPLFPFLPDSPLRSVAQSEPIVVEQDDPFAPSVLVGIARSPTPEPTLYRIEGRRDRPVTRVIRIGTPEPRSLRRPRDRFAHAETGALLLTVPGR